MAKLEEVAWAIVVLPVRVVDANTPFDIEGAVPKTREPEPVSSVMSEANSAEVSMEVLLILLLKTAQSVAVSLPVLVADAIGKLKVIVSPEAVMVKSLPFVEVANVTEVPDCREPAGPIDVMPPLPEPHANPVPDTVPELFI